MSNSEVKLLSADDSVGFPHAKVGRCQAFFFLFAPLFFVFFYLHVVYCLENHCLILLYLMHSGWMDVIACYKEAHSLQKYDLNIIVIML